MNGQKRCIRKLLGALAGIGLCSGVSISQSLAQSYPTKPIRLILGFAPGGSTDIVTRLMAQRLTESLGQPLVLDYREGAGGTIGTQLASRAASDGYTIIMGTSSTFGANPAMYKNLSYDVIKDFAPVIFISFVPNVLVVHPSVAAKSVQELVALAKAKPGQLNFASSGIGGTTHLAGELFKVVAGVDIVHVPYKGTGQALTDLLSGQVQMSFSTVISMFSHIKAGKLRPLAVTSPKRVLALPEIQTMAESKLPGVNALSWNGFLVPTNTPRAIVEKLNSESNRILNLPEVHEQLTKQGAEPVGGTPEEFSAFVKAEITKWDKVIKAAGIRGE